MPGRFVVVAEPISLIAYLNETPAKTTPFEGRRGKGFREGMAIIGRVQRALGKQMFDIGKYKFLMLLLMMHTQYREHAEHFVFFCALQNLLHTLVDIITVFPRQG